MLSQVLVATGEGNVVLLQAAEGQLHQAAHVKLDAEIACLDITPLTEGSQEASVAAVGTWRQQLHLYTLPDMKPVTQVKHADMCCRSCSLYVLQTQHRIIPDCAGRDWALILADLSACM